MDTRRFIIACIVLTLALFPAAAQTITLVNLTQGHVFVGTIPVNDQEYDRISENPLVIKSLITEEFPQLIGIAPGSFVQHVPAFRNDTCVYGFVQFPGREGAPIFKFRIPSTGIEQSYAISSAVFIPSTSPSQEYLSFSSFEIPTADQNRIVIDRRFVDWLQVPDLRRYSVNFQPSQIIARTGSEASAIQFEDAFFWEKAGVHIERTKAVAGQTHLYFMFSSFHPITAGTRFILRYFPDETMPNTASIEIPVRSETGGPVYLWVSGQTEPIVIGQYSAANFSLEAEVDSDILASLTEYSSDDAETYWELSTGAAEAGLYEEYYYGGISNEELYRFD